MFADSRNSVNVVVFLSIFLKNHTTYISIHDYTDLSINNIFSDGKTLKISQKYIISSYS